MAKTRDVMPMDTVNTDLFARTTARPATRPKPTAKAPAKAAKRTKRSDDGRGRPAYSFGGRRPAADLSRKPERFGVYLLPEQFARLRAEVVKRQEAGERMDLSMLIRELVDKAFPVG